MQYFRNIHIQIQYTYMQYFFFKKNISALINSPNIKFCIITRQLAQFNSIYEKNKKFTYNFSMATPRKFLDEANTNDLLTLKNSIKLKHNPYKQKSFSLLKYSIEFFQIISISRLKFISHSKSLNKEIAMINTIHDYQFI